MWERHWTTWKKVSLDGFPLHDYTESEYGQTRRMSTLITEKVINSINPESATLEAYELIRTKLNILSAISEKGLSIEKVFPAGGNWPGLSEYINYLTYAIPKTKIPRGTSREAIKMHPVFEDLHVKASKEEDKYMTENVDTVPQFLEGENIERTITLGKWNDLQDEWLKASSAFGQFSQLKGKVMNQSMELYRSVLQSRELLSRYLLDWAAIDMATECLSDTGKYKMNKMSRNLGEINGVTNLIWTLSMLYEIRNDIAHGRNDPSPEFLSKCKRGLFWLEWILVAFYRTSLGLEQRSVNVAPKYEL